ncbi:hypothetical protein E3U23_05015 [Erythrobacter litoralis]|uniref:hypothetical protein n=1 Tax=Erythrobacter litoralis TaxID=39960 RepID=UPI0024351307|nr:hypothetical protein [Erythrobacter litoralis]MDG6078553.1 hypothetical protein [Erythrobacter litoralis]
MIRPLFVAASLTALTACVSVEEPQTPVEGAAIEGPAGASASMREDAIRHFLTQEYPDTLPMRYALAWSDLNDDGEEEAIVQLVGSYFCGTGGCNTVVLTSAGPSWRKVGDISVSRTPVTVMDTSTKGWKDITVAIAGGGGAAGNALLKFDGEAYPTNPTVQPAEIVGMTGTVLISEDLDLVDLAKKEASGG